jgi:putative transposase
LVDTEGLVLKTFISAANLNDREGLYGILDRGLESWPSLKKIWVDGGYQGCQEIGKIEYGLDIEVIKKQNPKTFQVVPRRWVVERTFAWLGKNRRLSKDYEQDIKTSESMIYIGMTSLMLRRASKMIFNL